MKVKFKRTIAGLLSVLVAFTMIVSGQAKWLVKAEEQGGKPQDNNIVVQFGGEGVTVSGNEVTYTVGDKSVKVTVSGNTISGNSVEVPRNTLESVEFVLDDNYDPNTMQVKVSAADGFSTELKVNGKVTSLAMKDENSHLQDSLKFVIESKETGSNENPPGENQQPSSWENQYDEFLENGINILSFWIGSSAGEITYEFSEDYDNWNSSTKVTLDRATVEECLSTLKNPESTDEAKKDAKSKLFGIQKKARYMRLTAGKDLGGNHMGFEVFKKDGEGNLARQENVKFRYYDYRSGDFKEYSEHERDWEDYLKCSSYPVDGIEKPTQGLILDLKSLELNDYILRAIIPFDSRKNISWWNYKYKEQVAAAEDPVSDDSWVENGNVELVKVVSGNQVYYSNEPNWQPDQNLDENLVVKVGKAGYDFENGLLRPGYTGAHGKFTAEEMLEAAEKASGQCNVPEGSYVTVKLTPDAGYQILAAQLNGMALTPDANVPSQFTFQCTSNIHFQAIFEEAKDVVSVSGAEEVAAAQLTGGADVVDTGNVALTISDDTDYDAANALQIVNGTKVASLDVLIDQIIAKAGNLNEEEQRLAREGTINVTEDKFWKNNLTELTKPVDIQLDLDNITLAANETLAMVRDHNGTCEEIPVTVSNENGKVSVKFSSDKFSTYTIVKKNVESNNGSNGGTNTGGGSSSGGSSSGGSSSSGTTDTTKPSNDSNKGNSNTTTETKPNGSKVETTTETKPDGTKVETTTETKPDGTKLEAVTETKPDGSKVETNTETKADGSKTETVVETSKDGAVKTTETVTKTDGSATKTEKETETNAKGKEVAVTTTTKTDASGAVTSITEKSVIAQSSDITSTTVTVKKDAKGEITAATASIANTVKSGNKATVSAEIVSQIVEAAGTGDVRVSMTVKDAEGKTKYTLKVEAENLKAGEELFIYKLDTKTGKYTMVNAKTYEVSKDGSVAVSLSKKATYELVNAKDAAKISKEIKNSIKPKKASASVKEGKKTNFTLSSKADKENIKSITYTTSKKSVATVNKNGKIATKGKGSATVKAIVILKNGDKKTIKMTIKVK